MPSTVDQYKKPIVARKPLTYPQMRVIAAKCGMLDKHGKAKPLLPPKQEIESPPQNRMWRREL